MVSNGEEEYVYYTPRNRRKYARMVMKYDGGVQAGIALLDSYNCVGDSTKGGCERWEGPKCRSNGDKYEMKTVAVTDVRSTKYSTYNRSVTLYDCMDMCWKDCQCLGVYAEDVHVNGCVFLIGPYAEGDGKSFQVITRHHSKKSLLELMTSDEMGEITEFQDGNNGHNLNIYTTKLINSATNCFSPENLLGKGGFGPVFKGTLPNGQEVAIKRLSRGSGQGLVEFKNELILIAKLQHTNLVRLLGFCVQGEDKMLVYEYMPNKSLDFSIFVVTWLQNMQWGAWELWKHGASLELVDPTLSDSCCKSQVLRCITLGLLCVEDSPLDRPTMSDVISMLNGEMQLPLPKRPAFSTARNMVDETNSMVEKEKENYTINGRLSMSEMDPR
ncbi:hypothetical protein COLO4_35049 [Corchorus olitorius]|uniref:Protein kinase domain-containing protein n=1 Tax=Corchorus olitorius TaxID=93759 RepID=A0A1R3GIF7_9ROSI|nr:hypothetical protein COLO4_35049 [Corchorus olitorius]